MDTEVKQVTGRVCKCGACGQKVVAAYAAQNPAPCGCEWLWDEETGRIVAAPYRGRRCQCGAPIPTAPRGEGFASCEHCGQMWIHEYGRGELFARMVPTAPCDTDKIAVAADAYRVAADYPPLVRGTDNVAVELNHDEFNKYVVHHLWARGYDPRDILDVPWLCHRCGAVITYAMRQRGYTHTCDVCGQYA